VTRRIICLFAAACLLSAAPAAELTPDTIAQIEQAISTEMSRSTIPGVTVAIGSGSEVVWSNAYGLADLENTVPMTRHTVIRLASISKPITAVAILQLVEQGKLQLDAPIQQYVPQFPAKSWPVTVRQLLGHLGGVRHYREGEISSTRHYSDRLAPLDIFAYDPLLHEPGTRYSYTTYGYNLLGAAVELVSATPFLDYLQTNIFRPANIQSIRDDHVYALIPHRARGYALRDDGQLVNCGLADTSNKIPGGGLIGPAADLVRFALAFSNGKLVSPATVELMTRSLTTAEGKSTGYGLGFGLGELAGRPHAHHGGGQQGTTTYLLFFPREKLAVAVMMNREGAPGERLATRIAHILLQP
jgi:serine beta-lactamase-like protein LACTB, mitochondrial